MYQHSSNNNYEQKQREIFFSINKSVKSSLQINLLVEPSLFWCNLYWMEAVTQHWLYHYCCNVFVHNYYPRQLPSACRGNRGEMWLPFSNILLSTFKLMTTLSVNQHKIIMSKPPPSSHLLDPPWDYMAQRPYGECLWTHSNVSWTHPSTWQDQLCSSHFERQTWDFAMVLLRSGVTSKQCKWHCLNNYITLPTYPKNI